MKYPYLAADGTYHASRHVEIDVNWESVRNELNREEWNEGQRTIYLGSWLSMSPSGKIYAPFACSNVNECPGCGGGGDVASGRKLRLVKKYKAKVRRLRRYLMRYYGSYCEGRWPAVPAARLLRWDRLASPRVTCPRCHGVGSAEAYDDELFTEALEGLALAEGLWVDFESGDIFIGETSQEEEDA